MESVEAKVEVPVIPAKVADIKKVGDWWFVRFEGSWEFLRLGIDEPQMKIGDAKEIVIRNPRHV